MLNLHDEIRYLRSPPLHASCWSTGFSLPCLRKQQAKACTPAVWAQSKLKQLEEVREAAGQLYDKPSGIRSVDSTMIV